MFKLLLILLFCNILLFVADINSNDLYEKMEVYFVYILLF